MGEVVLAAYFFGALVFSIAERYWLGVPFLLIFFNGFAYTAGISILSRWDCEPELAPAAT